MAWWPSLLLAGELGLSAAGGCYRGRAGDKARNASALPQVTGLAHSRSKIVKVFKFMPLTSTPGRIRTCAHGSGEGCCV